MKFSFIFLDKKYKLPCHFFDEDRSWNSGIFLLAFTNALPEESQQCSTWLLIRLDYDVPLPQAPLLKASSLAHGTSGM